MIIPTRVLKKWKSEIEHGDLQKIAEKAGKSYVTVYRALKSKECTPELFESISLFVEERKASNKKLLSKRPQLTEAE